MRYRQTAGDDGDIHVVPKARPNRSTQKWPHSLAFKQARREPQQGPGKHSRGAPKHFHGAFILIATRSFYDEKRLA